MNWAEKLSLSKFSSRKLDLVAILLLALTCAGFYWRILFGGAWMPSGGGDLVSFLWPTYTFAARSLRSGVLPLWNPYLYSGMPFAADNQSGLFYPVNLLVFLLVPRLTYFVMELMSVAHVWWAGVGMYILLRTMKARRVPAFAGALAWMFSDVFVIHFGNYNLIAVASWLPLIFATFRKALAPRSPLSRESGEGGWGGEGLRCALVSGALWGMASLAGHAQMMLFIGLWLGGYALFATFCSLPFSRNREKGRAREGMRVRPLILFAVTALIAFGFAALMIIPANEMTRYTGRAGLDYGEATLYSLTPAALVGLVVPGLFGRGAGSWSPWLRVEVGYVGVLTLGLAVLGAMLKRKRERHGERAFLAIATVAAFLLAFGGYSALHGWLYRFVPLFGQLRAPARTVMLADFALAILAGLGLDALMSPLARYARAVLRTLSRGMGWIAVGLAGIGLPVIYFLISLSAYDAGLAHRFSLVMNGIVLGVILLVASSLVLAARRGRWTTPARVGIFAVVVLAVDLVVLGSSVDVETNDPTVGYNHPAVVDFLQRDKELFRIDSEPASAWQSDAGAMHAVGDIRGIFNPLGLAAYNTYLGGMGPRGSALYNFLNVKYVLSEKGDPPDDARFRLAFSDDPQVDVYLNAAALPRVMLIYQSILVTSGEQAWAAIHQPEFDPSRQVVVEGGPVLNGTPSSGALTIRHWDPNSIELDAMASIPTYVVLSEVYYPGWHAEVDGHAAKIFPANFAFRAVYLEPGTHRVRMFFQPASWTLGVAISAVTWCALLLAFVWRRRPAKTS
jgi:hypothetical protein